MIAHELGKKSVRKRIVAIYEPRARPSRSRRSPRSGDLSKLPPRLRPDQHFKGQLDADRAVWLASLVLLAIGISATWSATWIASAPYKSQTNQMDCRHLETERGQPEGQPRFEGGFAMGAILRPTAELDPRKNGFSAEEKADLDAPEVWPEVDALLEKIERLSRTNKHLRDLVTQLSVLVIRNVVEREP